MTNLPRRLGANRRQIYIRIKNRIRSFLLPGMMRITMSNGYLNRQVRDTGWPQRRSGNMPPARVKGHPSGGALTRSPSAHIALAVVRALTHVSRPKLVASAPIALAYTILPATLLNGCMIAGTIITRMPRVWTKSGKAEIVHFALPVAVPTAALPSQYVMPSVTSLNRIQPMTTSASGW